MKTALAHAVDAFNSSFSYQKNDDVSEVSAIFLLFEEDEIQCEEIYIAQTNKKISERF